MGPPENSVTNSRADCALTQQMVGCINAISPCLKSTSTKLFPDLHTRSAPSGEERTLEEAAQVECAAWCCGQRNSNTPTSCVAVFLSWSCDFSSMRAVRVRLPPHSAVFSSLPRSRHRQFDKIATFTNKLGRLELQSIEWAPPSTFHRPFHPLSIGFPSTFHRPSIQLPCGLSIHFP